MTMKYDADGKVSDVAVFGTDGTPCSILFVCNELLPNSQAASLGVHVGDVWVKLNQFDCLNVSSMHLAAIMQRLDNQKKTLTVARKENGVYRLLVFEFQPGTMGITYDPKLDSEKEKEAIMKAVSKKN